MRKNKLRCAMQEVSMAIGAGIIAGAAGTVAITVCQAIEMKITKRKAGVGPAKAVEKTLHLRVEAGEKKNLANKVHWVYGSLWGVIRGLLGISRMNNWLATTAHFAAITSTAMAISPLEDAKPVKDWSAKEISIDLLHHAVYAIVTSVVFDAIYKED